MKRCSKLREIPAIICCCCLLMSSTDILLSGKGSGSSKGLVSRPLGSVASNELLQQWKVQDCFLSWNVSLNFELKKQWIRWYIWLHLLPATQEVGEIEGGGMVRGVHPHTVFHVDIPIIFANLGIHSVITFTLQSRGSLRIDLVCIWTNSTCTMTANPHMLKTSKKIKKKDSVQTSPTFQNRFGLPLAEMLHSSVFL